MRKSKMNNINQSLQEIASGFANLGYRVEYTLDGVITGAIYKPTPRAKVRKEKMIYGYRFKTAESLIENLQKELNRYISNLEADAKAKVEQKIKNELLSNSIVEGDIFVASWGYEQTNVNFYQVVSKPSSKTAIIREIGYETVETCGWASENVRPIKDSFIGEEEKHRLNGDWIKFSSYKFASKIENPETSKHYRSWYS
jgi:hypothetical protein